jgi:hypothetical protein
MTDDIDQFVDENRDSIERVLRHSNNAYARACAWTLLDAGSDDPDIDALQRELDQLQQQREVQA